MCASALERVQLYKVLSEERPSWSHTMRKILDSRAPSLELQTKKQAGFQEGE